MWGTEESPAPVTGYSFPYGVPLVFFPVFLYLAHCGAGHWWEWVFHGLFVLAVSAFAWTAVSRAQYEKIHAQDPSLNRLTWVLNYLLFFVLGPTLLWLLLFLPRFVGQ